MFKTMLIDAIHPEETRVAIVDQSNVLVECDVKSAFKPTNKSNIYLAKIARVEPSLQAAFVDYGGNRHGFLSFSEIHPDYFRIPVSDRERIDAEIKSLEAQSVAEADCENESDQIPDVESSHFNTPKSKSNTFSPSNIATVGGESASHDEETDDNFMRRLSLHRRYKIQEVIYRNQIVLVQVNKEERGGKGAALTTYLSLPGRYCVLMPNSPRSGGISRKISTVEDRKRLRKVLSSLEIPSGMGLIVRTAGKERTKVELKRDAEYLMRLWNNIRETTLQSVAPSNIYKEDDIIKRAIRDFYSKDMDNILVEGKEGFEIARNFMKTLMPSHTKRIQLYKDDKAPLFYAYGIERQIDQMHLPQVSLPSGGSIVINPTEALVSIDINSGRATRERHIEETATKTNLEATVEIARQIRLRDLAGLIVVDFIDMEDSRNIAMVERRMKEVFRFDRARVQMSKISPFGLMELSRQRLNPSILETSAYPCPHCSATGYVRSTESLALQVLRELEAEGIARPSSEILMVMPTSIASYIFNNKRAHLSSIETRHQLITKFELSEHIEKPGFKIIWTKNSSPVITAPTVIPINSAQNERSLSSGLNEIDSSNETPLISLNEPGEHPEISNRKHSQRSRWKNKKRVFNISHSKQDISENIQILDSDSHPTNDLPDIISSSNQTIQTSADQTDHDAPFSDETTRPRNYHNRRRNYRRYTRRSSHNESTSSDQSTQFEQSTKVTFGQNTSQPEPQKSVDLTDVKKKPSDKEQPKKWWKRLLE